MDDTLSAAGANNPDFVALSDTIRILDAYNSGLQRLLYQPYQIDAIIKFDWHAYANSYTGPAPVWLV